MGRKLGSGEGSIFKTDNGWRGQISLGGKRRSVSGRTKKEVADKLAALRVKYNSGDLPEVSSITVKEWVDQWIDTRVAPKLTEQSLIRLRLMFDNHIIPAIGEYKLQSLTKPMLEEMYAQVFQCKVGKKYKEPNYSHSTVNSLAVQFKKCLQYAVDEGVLTKNPHNGVELHKLRPPKKISAYSLTDHEKIVQYCKNGKWVDRIYYLLIATGIRFGEAAALTWDDIDFKEKKMSITKTAISLHGSMYIQEHPKTAAGTRTIYLSDKVIEWLEEIRGNMDSELNYRNLVLPNTNYNITNQANSIARWRRVCAELNIPYSGMHALRHTWATRALEKNIDVKTVSAMLGHKNVITTMNIYQDVLPAQQVAASNALDDLF